MDWIDGIEDANLSVAWVNGGPGVGKSAIAQTVAERLEEEGKLVASYFFSRTDPTRNNATRFIASIAYHLTVHLPMLKAEIVRAVERDPLIFQLSLDAQFQALIARPVYGLAQSGYFVSKIFPRVVVIDGLDECDELRTQMQILNTICNALRKNSLPLLFLIASRPERHISLTFSSGCLREFHAGIALDNFFSSADIQLFLEDRFEDLKMSHPLRTHLPSPWPSFQILHALVLKASGQFIYASTVMKFVSSIRHRPDRRLDVVLGLHPTKEHPFAELDALYIHIFSSIEEDRIQLILDVLAHRILSPSFLTITEMEAFLNLEAGDIDTAFCDLGSITSIEGHDEYSGDQYLGILHASLRDFLLDSSRSEKFHIDPPARYASYALRYLRLFQTPDRAPMVRRTINLPHVFQEAPLTPLLRQEILSFSFVEARLKLPQYHISAFHSFIGSILQATRCDPFTYKRLQERLWDYHAEYLPDYFSDTELAFLIELLSIEMYWPTIFTSKGGFPYPVPIQYYESLFSPSAFLDRDKLGITPLLFAVTDVDRLYKRHLSESVLRASRSGTLALSSEHFTAGTLRCLMFLCCKRHSRPCSYAGRVTLRRRKNRPYLWRTNFRPLERKTRKYLIQQAKIAWTTQLSFKNGHCVPAHNTLTDRYLHSRVYGWTLRCFQKMLRKAEYSEDLLRFISCQSFTTLIQDWPREASSTRAAISSYVQYYQNEIFVGAN